jgi:hypothetical protein
MPNMLDQSPGHSTSVHPPETNGPGTETSGSTATEQQAKRFALTGMNAQELSQVFRHSGWADHRRLVYQALIRTNQSVSRISGFAECGHGAYVLQSPEPPVRYRVAGSACHDRFCNPCATERSRVIAQNVIDRIGHTRVRFITLTLRHGDEPLAELLTRLTSCFRVLQRTALWKQGVTGGVGFVEVKWNTDSESWHPHLHLLVEGRFIEKSRLQETWLAVTGDSYVVDIRLPGGHTAVARYVTKYASKPLSTTFLYNKDRLHEAIRALKGRRLCTTFGGWRGVLLVDKVDEEAWINVGPLSDWIERAHRGDASACEVLQQIDANKTAACLELTPPPQPRPPPQAPVRRHLQSAFWELAPLCY